MTDVEQKVRAGLHALAGGISPLNPPVSPLRRMEVRRRRPARAIAIGVGLAMVGVTAAAATGTTPSEVRDAFARFAGWDFAVEPDDAELMASSVGRDGRVAEYWVGIGEDGSRCDYVRVREADGSGYADGWSACTRDPAQHSGSDGMWLVASPEGDRSVAGHVPEKAVAVVVHFENGASERLQLTNGYFIAEFGPEADDLRGRIELVTAINAEQVVVSSHRYTT